MAAWGLSWGLAWGSAWGATAPLPPPTAPNVVVVDGRVVSVTSPLVAFAADEPPFGVSIEQALAVLFDSQSPAIGAAALSAATITYDVDESPVVASVASLRVISATVVNLQEIKAKAQESPEVHFEVMPCP